MCISRFSIPRDRSGRELLLPAGNFAILYGILYSSL